MARRHRTEPCKTKWSDLLRRMVRGDHWASDFCRRLKQRTIHNRRMGPEDLILVCDPRR